MGYNIALTALGATPGLCIRADLMAWKMSATPSVFRCSNWEWMQMKVPVRPTPSLKGRDEVGTYRSKYCIETLYRFVAWLQRSQSVSIVLYCADCSSINIFSRMHG